MTALLDTNILMDILSSSREGHDTASCALDNWCDVIVSNDSGTKHYTDLDILSPQELIDRCLNQA